MHLYKNDNGEVRGVTDSIAVSRNDLVEKIEKAQRQLLIAQKDLETFDALNSDTTTENVPVNTPEPVVAPIENAPTDNVEPVDDAQPPVAVSTPPIQENAQPASQETTTEPSAPAMIIQ